MDWACGGCLGVRSIEHLFKRNIKNPDRKIANKFAGLVAQKYLRLLRDLVSPTVEVSTLTMEKGGIRLAIPLDI